MEGFHMNKTIYILFIIFASAALSRVLYNGGSLITLLGLGYIALIAVGYVVNLKKDKR